MHHPRPILIAGPTASGKSSLALKLAVECNGVIINADALQVYECYSILTARPNDRDIHQVDHHLYGHIPNIEGYSVGVWLNEIKALLDSLTKTPIIVGGTGLYFKSLTEGLAYIPPTEPKIREQIQAEFEEHGLAFIQNKLKHVDPDIIVTIDIQNPRRVMRALEVFEQTGRTLSSWQADTPAPLIESENCQRIVIMPDVETTNKRITDRFSSMMDTGAVAEVRAQMPFDPKLPANKALGALQIAAYLDGELSKEAAIEQSVILTRQYAKRQRSWFRSNMKGWEFRNNPI